jgi:cystathionine gamma-synthase
VDNTFATPVNQNPVALGADLVIHSATKFICGHNDALGGVVCGRRGLVERIYRYRELTGSALDPFSAYLMIRSLKTLALRVRQQNQNALEIARFLEEQPQIQRVYYPGLPGHPGHAVAAGQMRGFGGVLSFDVRGGLEAIKKMLPRLRYGYLAANLGQVATIAGPPAATSHVECTAEERAAAGIPEGLVRYAVGIEDVEDLKVDLAQALEHL